MNGESRSRRTNSGENGSARGARANNARMEDQSAAALTAEFVDEVVAGLKERARRADPKLKQELTGKTLVRIFQEDSSSYRSLSLEWSSETLVVEQLSSGAENVASDNGGSESRVAVAGDALEGAATESPAECVISLSQTSLKRIASGALNPQIAMLSGAVKAEGKTHLAIYFFNLIVPSNEPRSRADTGAGAGPD